MYYVLHWEADTWPAHRARAPVWKYFPVCFCKFSLQNMHILQLYLRWNVSHMFFILYSHYKDIGYNWWSSKTIPSILPCRNRVPGSEVSGVSESSTDITCYIHRGSVSGFRIFLINQKIYECHSNMPQPSCMCTVLLKLAKVERLKMKVVACYYDTHLFFWFIKNNRNPENEPLWLYPGQVVNRRDNYASFEAIKYTKHLHVIHCIIPGQYPIESRWSTCAILNGVIILSKYFLQAYSPFIS